MNELGQSLLQIYDLKCTETKITGACVSCRSHCCLKEKKDLMMQKGFQISDFKVLTSYRSQASLSSEEVNRDKLLIDCGDDQECVLGMFFFSLIFALLYTY